MIVDKPMTKILPELYEENNETPSVYSNLLSKSNNNNNIDYRLKRNKVSHSKNEIMSSNFNFLDSSFLFLIITHLFITKVSYFCH